MKFTTTTLAILASSTTVSAFMASRAFVPKTQLSAQKPDATDAIEAALEASKKFGATSPEARVAWDTVEELSAADNSVASRGTLEDECDIEEEITTCLEYETKKAELTEALKEIESFAGRFNQVKYIAEEMQNIKLKEGKAKPVQFSPEVEAALQEAKDAASAHGKDSVEAKLAWAQLEEISSNGLSNSIGKRLDEECLVESAVEACMALEELNRVLNLEKSRDSGLNA